MRDGILLVDNIRCDTYKRLKMKPGGYALKPDYGCVVARRKVWRGMGFLKEKARCDSDRFFKTGSARCVLKYGSAAREMMNTLPPHLRYVATKRSSTRRTDQRKAQEKKQRQEEEIAKRKRQQRAAEKRARVAAKLQEARQRSEEEERSKISRARLNTRIALEAKQREERRAERRARLIRNLKQALDKHRAGVARKMVSNAIQKALDAEQAEKGKYLTMGMSPTEFLNDWAKNVPNLPNLPNVPNKSNNLPNFEASPPRRLKPKKRAAKKM